MRRKFKKVFGKWFDRFVLASLVFFVLYVNANRLFENNYANYEKVVEYGRVRETEEKPASAIAAVFYAGNTENKGFLTTYFGHADNYKRDHVKMIVVPKRIDQSAREVVEKLYFEVKQKNLYAHVLLVHDQTGDWAENRRMLAGICEDQAIESILLAENDLMAFEEKVDTCVQKEKCLVVWVADLSESENVLRDNLLVQEMVFFAQKNFYHMKVFDVIDTQMAAFLENRDQLLDYFGIEDAHGLILKQRYNLRQYIRRYGKDIIRYFAKYFGGDLKQNILWPEKDSVNFRLYDRGTLHVRLKYEDRVISKTKSNEAVVVSAIKIARSFGRKYPHAKITDARLFLLTEKEYLDVRTGDNLEDFIADDEGIGAEYGRNSVLIFPQDRQEITTDLRRALRRRLKNPPTESNVRYFKFGIEELKDEN